jgi:hypothetical protein
MSLHIPSPALTVQAARLLLLHDAIPPAAAAFGSADLLGSKGVPTLLSIRQNEMNQDLGGAVRKSCLSSNIFFIAILGFYHSRTSSHF